MPRIKCIISYDGTGFYGYQVQPGKRTVQSELEKALEKLNKGTSIRVSASGRTDAGVHARGQVIHFDTMLEIEPARWQIALNSLLPDDIAVHSVELARPDFHARFDAVGKEYRYFLLPSKHRDPFQRNYAYQFPYEQDLEAMKEAARLLLGTHDFTSFCSAKTEVEDRVRTLQEIDFFEENGLLVFRFVGNGFLYNMVRILVGTLLEVGTGRRAADSMLQLLQAQDRTRAGKTAPGHGLYLWKVFYGEEDHQFEN
ncbi:tRNA pseudouridine(38-40) synthase TruA [Bacillus sp. ISL-35]|uniref:tRNA pseudouridine(38-40) synthase TruA n=1 Tax=Bacillus sp. ISL-35 TaxID=2819122 RepID=UPI001BEA0A1E|nr:tRNA pseudouridine(38-40) synthase TruA [Bacillus sp. ISL-35]MBT2681176.1 tRNA pseudouridine(38-40) synthase TruA [Bacillus sp. ISL-35]MBT2706166.1 tRNA pseudouridine(38-40) synthase TruA [Chryseobacterium sp. ISL-80]